MSFEMVSAMVVIRDGTIEAVLRSEWEMATFAKSGCPVRDVGSAVLMAGLVDAGARFGECGALLPGSASDCFEGFGVGTRGAAAGGVTTTLDLPSLDAPLAEANDIAARAAAARATACVDVALCARLEPAAAASLGGRKGKEHSNQTIYPRFVCDRV